MENFIKFDFKETINTLPFKVIDYFTEFNSYSYDKKLSIGTKTDHLVSLGNSEYRSGNLEAAVKFYHSAINEHIINNDAYQNLFVCYQELGIDTNAMHVEYVWNCVKELKGI